MFNDRLVVECNGQWSFRRVGFVCCSYELFYCELHFQFVCVLVHTAAVCVDR